MSDYVRCHLTIPAALADYLDELRKDRKLTRAAAMRRALGIMQTVDEAVEDGFYIGGVRDRSLLERVISTPRG